MTQIKTETRGRKKKDAGEVVVQVYGYCKAKNKPLAKCLIDKIIKEKKL